MPHDSGGVFVRAGRYRRVEHGKSIDKRSRICYQFTCVREDCRGTTWSIPDGWDGYGVAAKACIFGPVGRSSKPRTIDCPEGRKKPQSAGITKRLPMVEA